MALLKGTTVYDSGPFFFAEGVALWKAITVYNSGSFFFAEGVALLKGTTVYDNGPFYFAEGVALIIINNKYTSPNMVLLWQLFYLFGSCI